MKGWYGNRYGHSLASKGIKTKRENLIMERDRINSEIAMLDKDIKIDKLVRDLRLYGTFADLSDWGMLDDWIYGEKWVDAYFEFKKTKSEEYMESFLLLVQLFDEQHNSENYEAINEVLSAGEDIMGEQGGHRFYEDEGFMTQSGETCRTCGRRGCEGGSSCEYEAERRN